jgi:hypothetical protein
LTAMRWIFMERYGLVGVSQNKNVARGNGKALLARQG